MRRTLSAHGGAAIYLIAILVNLGIQLLGSIVLAVVMLLSGNGGVPGFVNYILMAVLQLGFLLSFRLYTKKTNRGIAFPVRVPNGTTCCFACSRRRCRCCASFSRRNGSRCGWKR